MVGERVVGVPSLLEFNRTLGVGAFVFVVLPSNTLSQTAVLPGKTPSNRL